MKVQPAPSIAFGIDGTILLIAPKSKSKRSTHLFEMKPLRTSESAIVLRRLEDAIAEAIALLTARRRTRQSDKRFT